MDDQTLKRIGKVIRLFLKLAAFYIFISNTAFCENDILNRTLFSHTREAVHLKTNLKIHEHHFLKKPRKYKRNSPNSHIITPDEFTIVFEKALEITENENKNTQTLQKSYPNLGCATHIRKKTFEKDDKVFIQGDLHGDVLSLVSYLNFLFENNHIDQNFVLKPKTHLVFLGDYTDRGLYGIDVLATVFLLKIKNPENVTLVRGNHEEVGMNKQDSKAPLRNFWDELSLFITKKNPLLYTIEDKLERFYDSLPSALLMFSPNSKKFILGSHGGFEVGVDIRNLVKSKALNAQMCVQSIDRNIFTEWALKNDYSISIIDDLSITPMQKLRKDFQRTGTNFGFMWNDYSFEQSSISRHKQNRGHIVGKNDTDAYFEMMGVYAQIRAHQHNEETLSAIWAQNGIHRLYSSCSTESECVHSGFQGEVFTFSMGLDSCYGYDMKHEYDSKTSGDLLKKTAVGLLEIDETLENSTLKVINPPFVTKDQFEYGIWDFSELNIFSSI